MRGHNSWVAIIWVISPWILQAQSVDADRVLILANANVPESMLLAEFYREQRGIAREQVLHVDIIAEESIDYRAFVDGIWNPIREYLTSTKLVKGRTEINEEEYGRNLLRIDESQLKYIVICKGIPLKISRGLEVLQFNHDEIPQAFRTVQASVDSELALILNNRTDPIGILKNPNFDPPLSHLVDYRYSVAVGRIEGPSYAISRRMILDGIETERNGGLVGRAYVDLHPQHPLGNQWFMNAADSIHQFGLDIDIESTDRHWSLSDRHDAPAIYLGWYSGNANGPAVSNQVDVPSGAIAWHIHSLSAYSLNETNIGWVAPLIQNGFATAFGNVEEPYLEYTQRPDVFIKYVLNGHTVGEASLFSLPYLSWQTVMVGDPLYRPFPKSTDYAVHENSYAQMLNVNRQEAEDALLAREYALNTFLNKPSIQMAYKILIELNTGNEPEFLINSLVRAITQLPKPKSEEIDLYLKIAEELRLRNQIAGSQRILRYLRTNATLDIRHEARLNALSN